MAKKKNARGRRRSGGAGGGLSSVPVIQLRAELVRRQRRIKSLVKRYERLASSATVLRSEIEALGGTVNGAGRAFDGAPGVRRRPRNEMNLVEALKKLLTNKTMSVTEAAEKVQEAGYKTSSTTFRTIVNQTLINSGQFKRVGRGLYTAK